MSLLDLPVTIEAVAIDRLSADEGDRGTMLVTLTGRGAEGLGEDVSPFGTERFGPFVAPPDPALVGEWTLDGVCAHLAARSLWPEPPGWDAMRDYRRWAFQSAALDLALRQAGRSLPEVLHRSPRPVRFVHSLGLGEAPGFAPIADRLALYPDLRLKLDADAAWSFELIDELAATGAVEIVDFKGRYGFQVADEDRLATMYAHVLARLADALLEDPHDLEAIDRLIAPAAARVSFDAPIRRVADIAALGSPIVNVKPSRIGSLPDLLAIYEHCDQAGIRMYGGGMGELGVGRGQAQLLAAMFHPDGPNDLAPSPYNEPTLRGGLPVSPLAPGSIAGFRWEPGQSGSLALP